jgi:hypothetical protein
MYRRPTLQHVAINRAQSHLFQISMSPSGGRESRLVPIQRQDRNVRVPPPANVLSAANIDVYLNPRHVSIAEASPNLSSSSLCSNGTVMPLHESVRKELPAIMNKICGPTASNIGTTATPSGTLGASHYQPECRPRPFQSGRPPPSRLALFTSGGISSGPLQANQKASQGQQTSTPMDKMDHSAIRFELESFIDVRFPNVENSKRESALDRCIEILEQLELPSPDVEISRDQPPAAGWNNDRVIVQGISDIYASNIRNCPSYAFDERSSFNSLIGGKASTNSRKFATTSRRISPDLR